MSTGHTGGAKAYLSYIHRIKTSINISINVSIRDQIKKLKLLAIIVIGVEC